MVENPVNNEIANTHTDCYLLFKKSEVVIFVDVSSIYPFTPRYLGSGVP